MSSKPENDSLNNSDAFNQHEFSDKAMHVDEDGFDEDDNMYGDLDALHSDATTQKLLNLYEEAQKEIENIKTEREEMRQQIQYLSEQKKVLETNIVSIYNTATVEIERKNKLIKDLQTEIAKLRVGNKWFVQF